jgi:hypothetical protein
MKFRVLMYATMVAAVPASAQGVGLKIELMPGPPRLS